MKADYYIRRHSLAATDMQWPETITIAEARRLQEQLRRKVRIVPIEEPPRFIAGVDAAFSTNTVVAAACLYRFPEMRLVEKESARRELIFPYVPGFLSFREGPAVMEAIEKLRTMPDVVLVDGQGIAHPRGIGIASHIGVMLDIPTIGCAKTRLVGSFHQPAAKKGSRSSLVHEGKAVGAVIRTRDGVRPLFVSPGHRCDVASAARIVFACTRSFRIPEPLRCADMLSKQVKIHRAQRSFAP
jgi:deoxyribonuclease V